MPKLSIIIPSRDERFLIPTIDDIFRNAQGDTEVVAVLDSSIWPAGWKEVTERHPRLHTLHNGQSLGMRASINRGFGSAMSRGADYVMKLDGHCSLSEGFDITLLSEIEDNWVVIPRRGRLDPENWCATDTHKPDIDYHYLSFPSDPNDFGGPGLNGKVWDERARERKDILIDDEMSSQGSCWLTSVKNFERLELMDEVAWGSFWAEAQEVLMKNWLSGGRCVVNKNAKYLHLHKGRKYGRGYKLAESALVQGRNQAMKWIWNEAWPRQTLPFKWLIEHFWPVPSWPENWEEVLYAERKPRYIVAGMTPEQSTMTDLTENGNDAKMQLPMGLRIHSARYGIVNGDSIDVTERVEQLVKDNSLDIVVNNSTLTPNQNPFRGKRKSLQVIYSYDGGDAQRVVRDEKDWLIIGQAQRPLIGSNETAELVAGREGKQDDVKSSEYKFCPYCRERFVLTDGKFPVHGRSRVEELREVNPTACKGSGWDYIQNPAYSHIDAKSGAYVPAEVTPIADPPRTSTALNDYLIRKFNIGDRRLRAPMPIELPNFHRNDLAQLFAELGFKRGAEIGVAEGHYSEALLKANPECELLLVDPWHAYSENPQNKSKEKHEFAYNETLRKTKPFKRVIPIMEESMEYVRNVVDESLDFVYIDGNHSFDYVMQDLIEWSKRVRTGGIVSGDDYYQLSDRWGAGPVEAVQTYTKAHRIPIWYIFQGHKSVDFMWVRP